jgi:hypothetical protein
VSTTYLTSTLTGLVEALATRRWSPSLLPLAVVLIGSRRRIGRPAPGDAGPDQLSGTPAS